MTTIRINLPDDRAALLAAKAAQCGLTLEGWFQKLAEQEAPLQQPHYSLSELIAVCDPNVPMSDEDREWMDAPPVGCSAAKSTTSISIRPKDVSKLARGMF